MNKFRKLPQKLGKVIEYQIGSIVGHTNYSRFAIIGNARTGSNFLMDGIMSSGSVYMFHEIFADHNRKIGSDFDKIISKLYRRKGKRIRHVGVKIFYYHLTNEEWTKLLTHDDFKLIHIVRQNRLRTITSLEIALKTDQWVATPSSINNNKEKTVRINTTNLIKRIEKIHQEEIKTRERFKGRSLLEVAYENLITNPNEEFKKIKNFLGLPYIKPNAIKYKKQNPEGLMELIVNFEEVEQALNGTPYEDYLK